MFEFFFFSKYFQCSPYKLISGQVEVAMN